MNPSDKVVLDIDGVIEMTTLSQSTIYAMARRGEFPKQVRIGPNRVVWRRAEVVAWLEAKLDAAAA
jgi:prophage regulatory protein